MKGNPRLRLCLVLLLLVAVLIPVCRLTLSVRESRQPSPAGEKSSKGAVTTPLRGRLLLYTAPFPLRCTVTLGEKLLLSEQNVLAPGEYGAEVKVSPDEDLLITAEWNDGNPHAVRLEFLPSGMTAPISASYWAKRRLKDIFTTPRTTVP